MKIVKKLSALILVILLIGGTVFGATVTVNPSTVPIGTYVNGSDGDQYFVQALEFTWDAAAGGGDAWEDGDDVVITLPSSMTVADIDEDGSYNDEVDASWGAATDPVFVATATQTEITITVTTGANVLQNEKLTVLFPIETDETVTDGTTETYTFTANAATGVNEPSFSTVTVTYEADVLDLVTFSPFFSGGDQSSELGNVYPDANEDLLNAAITDFIVDQETGAGAGADNNSATFTDFDNDNTHAAGVASTTTEMLFYVWASQNPSLLKIDEEAGGHIPIVVDQPEETFSDISRGVDEPCAPVTEGDVFDEFQLNGTLLPEGTWYFYVTSSITGDWVLGKSDSIDVRHWPVFDNSFAGYEAIIDYDGDGLFEYGVNDDVTEMYLESGGGVGIDGSWGGTNADNASFHWNVKDVDDNANVKIFKSTTDGITDKATLLADANTVQISPDTLYEEGPTSVFWNYDIYTDATTYEEAGDYYIYFLADDGSNSNVFQLVDAADTDFQLKVKHFPNLVFQDVDYMHDENTGDTDIDFNTANQQYLTFNWGETVDGDKDADGDLKINLYLSQLALGASGYNANVSSTDSTDLANDASTNPNRTVHVATIIDTSDGRNDNRYAFDVRNAGLDAGTYYMYAVITEQGDCQVIQMEDVPGAGAEDRPVELAHSPYFLAKSPPEGEYVNLKTTDRYTFKWHGFDMDATATDLRVGVFMVPQGTATLASGVFDTDGLATADYYYLVSDDNGENIAANANAPLMSAGEYVVDFGDIDTDAAGNNTAPSGDYDVYFVYTDDGDFTDGADDICVKADGSIHFETFADPATNFELSPNRFVAEKGDTITLDIYATDGGVENAMILSVFMDVPTAKFSVIDQDAGSPGTQAWLDESVNFNGDEFLDTVGVNGDYYEIDYVEYASGGDALATSLKVGTVQLVATANYTGDALEKHEITFSTSGDRVTSIVGASNNTLATTVPTVAATVEFATPGKISGHVEIEARPDAEGETVDIYVVPEGSMDMISDADFLAANGLSSANDTLTYTLGAGGYYEVLRVPSGTYDVFIHKDGWLDQRISSQVVQQISTTNVDFEGSDKLLVGDCAGYTDADGNIIPDNQLATDDQNAVNSAFDSEPGDAHWNAFCDFDGNDKVYITDLTWSTKNSGSGEGLLYKKAMYNGSNEGAKFVIAKAGHNMYSIKASGLAHIRAYAATIAFNPDEWELKEVNDGLNMYKSSYNFYKNNENTVQFVSSLYGDAAITSNDLDIVTFGLNPKVEDPTMPELINVNVVDANFNETQGFVESMAASNVPTEFALEKNYPNPFNPTTNIRYAIPEQGNVKLVVYDLLGNKVSTLVSKSMKAGNYNAVWNAYDDMGVKVSSGVYFYRLMVDNKIVGTKKMVLMK